VAKNIGSRKLMKAKAAASRRLAAIKRFLAKNESASAAILASKKAWRKSKKNREKWRSGGISLATSRNGQRQRENGIGVAAAGGSVSKRTGVSSEK
jgi:hypothetical protein